MIPKPASVRYDDRHRIDLPAPETFTPTLPVNVIVSGLRPIRRNAGEDPGGLKAGDTMDIEITGIGTLSNPVVAGAGAAQSA